jgi:CheY-like chemotaxis protein
VVKPVKQSDLFDGIINALGYFSNEKAPVVPERTVKKAQSPLRILIVEDNVVNQKVAGAMLEKRGHSTLIASNGREALKTLDEESVDLILMDVQMPEMDGLEATRLIREKERADGRHVPIFAMTAHAMKGDRERCLAAGMDDYISKPIREADLFGVIESIGNGSEHRRKAKHSPVRENVHPVAQDIFDFSEAMKTVNGDKELFREIATLFLESAAQSLSQIREGIANKDAKTVENAAHSLKGSVANFGARRTFDAAYRMEQMGREGAFVDAESAQSELERELEALETAMQAAMTG